MRNFYSRKDRNLFHKGSIYIYMKYFIGEEYDIVYWKYDFKDFAG